METEQNESATSANETTNLKSDINQLLENIKIPDSPFTAIKLNDKWFLTMGKYRLTKELESLEHCQDEAKNASWDRIMQIILLMIKESEEIKKLENRIFEMEKELLELDNQMNNN